MKAEQFKLQLKAIESQLRGLSRIQLKEDRSQQFYSVRGFGLRVLANEAKSFRVRWAEVAGEVVRNLSFDVFAELLLDGKVSAVGFEAYKQYESLGDYISSFRLD